MQIALSLYHVLKQFANTSFKTVCETCTCILEEASKCMCMLYPEWLILPLSSRRQNGSFMDRNNLILPYYISKILKGNKHPCSWKNDSIMIIKVVCFNRKYASKHKGWILQIFIYQYNNRKLCILCIVQEDGTDFKRCFGAYAANS